MSKQQGIALIVEAESKGVNFVETYHFPALL